MCVGGGGGGGYTLSINSVYVSVLYMPCDEILVSSMC